MVSEEEAHRTIARGDYYAILPMLPELVSTKIERPLEKEYSSNDILMSKQELTELLKKHHLMIEDKLVYNEDMLA